MIRALTRQIAARVRSSALTANHWPLHVLRMTPSFGEELGQQYVSVEWIKFTDRRRHHWPDIGRLFAINTKHYTNKTLFAAKYHICLTTNTLFTVSGLFRHFATTCLAFTSSDELWFRWRMANKNPEFKYNWKTCFKSRNALNAFGDWLSLSVFTGVSLTASDDKSVFVNSDQCVHTKRLHRIRDKRLNKT